SRGERLVIQAEDGIRDDLVTGVQTCALPISRRGGASGSSRTANEPTFQPWPHLGASRTSCFQRRRPASSPPDGPLTLRAQPSVASPRLTWWKTGGRRPTTLRPGCGRTRVDSLRTGGGSVVFSLLEFRRKSRSQ